MKKTSFNLPGSVLAKRLIGRILIFGFVLMILTSLVAAAATWLHERSDLEKQLHDIQESYSDIIRAALWGE